MMVDMSNQDAPGRKILFTRTGTIPDNRAGTRGDFRDRIGKVIEKSLQPCRETMAWDLAVTSPGFLMARRTRRALNAEHWSKWRPILHALKAQRILAQGWSASDYPGKTSHK